MNKHILRLAKQSGLIKYDSDGKMEEVEKFAESIVKECSKVIVNGGYRNPAFGEKYPLAPPEIAKMIEEHFGVE